MLSKISLSIVQCQLYLGILLWFFIPDPNTCFAQERPNFIFILTDDQPYGYLGCTGNSIVQTPNLDNLAAEGMLFTNAHVTSAICTPSRASILLSQFERKHGVNFNSGTSLSEEAWNTSYPVVMKRNGYYTGWIGKNHVPVGEGGYSGGLMEKSFDYWYGGHGHLSFYPKSRHEIFARASDNTQVEIITEGVQDFLSDNKKFLLAKKFLEERPSKKPFVLSVCFNLPHGAGTSTMKQKGSDPEIYKSLYRDKTIPLPNHYIAKKDITTPKLPHDLMHVEDRQKSYDYVDTPETLRETYIRQLQAMTGIDQFVGKLRESLEQEGLAENTIIIFTSDHGLFMGQFGLGGKALCYEQTTHVPLIIYNPFAKKRQKGMRSDELVQTIDIAPTLLAMSNIEIPETYQGKDLSSSMADNKIRLREYLFTENLWSTHFGNPRCESVQSKKWKYIRYYRNNNISVQYLKDAAKQLGIPQNKMLYEVHDHQIAVYRSFIESPLNGEKAVYEELYDLETDPSESENLAADPKYLKKIQQLRQVWKREITYARGTDDPEVCRYTFDNGGSSK
ncbi:sulfatase-like hydrolase/transferase [Fulvivirga sp. M361]|uniref:sulfatase-like hydrolase/transferase n=1 Tax=Fulvivirga sp. M361 TaxID=2594266 RepID=UPI00117AE9BD|nr:sulfatase-like hydrolase/transferase [Fulvivirga sp. M361]TRX48067.1 sulfatase-like hydrolase/transferase [Fulvivirga sp. M361]